MAWNFALKEYAGNKMLCKAQKRWNESAGFVDTWTRSRGTD